MISAIDTVRSSVARRGSEAADVSLARSTPDKFDALRSLDAWREYQRFICRNPGGITGSGWPFLTMNSRPSFCDEFKAGDVGGVWGSGIHSPWGQHAERESGDRSPSDKDGRSRKVHIPSTPRPNHPQLVGLEYSHADETELKRIDPTLL
ncbi:MAG: hypothetical protein WC718_03770 [Phycisphaerales bacterium]|jgi:hypothetical protein